MKKLNVVEPVNLQFNSLEESISDILASNNYSNFGKYHGVFERAITRRLNAQTILCSNGTAALDMALRVVGKKGKVLTPAFAWISSASAIISNGYTPVFIDVDPLTFNIDVDTLCRALNDLDDVVGVLALHAFGNPCEIEKIQKLCGKHEIFLIFDAAHAFGSTFNNKSVFEFGDISTLSFHPTKIVNCGEGGACVVHNENIARDLISLRNFGRNASGEVVNAGSNFKLSEINAAIGLASLQMAEQTLHRRSEIDKIYRRTINQVTFQKIWKGANFAYTPILLENTLDRDRLDDYLRGFGINCRKYFNPTLDLEPLFSKYPSYEGLGESHKISDTILCLPNHPNLIDSDVDYICDKLVSHFK
jgi:dTDP-4-amino-4,6-dideoxygalactose transaminase